ncbi:MAG: diacylglycerol kinase family lipid kinase [Bacteroidales bacterium]|nr:diacylglycerol kinase family lipid kinase [Bacteroidales bacterium]
MDKYSKKKILIVINTSAGSGDDSGVLQELEEHLTKEKCTCRFIEIGGGKEPVDLDKEIRHFQPEIIVAAGGDGTVNLVASHIIEKKIKLGIIPLGSANGMAYQLGIPRQVSEALELILSSDSIKVDMLRINKKYYSIHMSDLGMNARVVKRYDEDKIRGLWGYARQYFRELFYAKKFHCKLSTGGHTVRSKVLMMVIANASHYGTGAAINPEGDIGDGLMEIILVKAYPALFLIYMIASFFGLKKYDPEQIEIISCKKAVISVSPPQHIQIDGEPLGSKDKVEVKIIPGAINVITPGTN